MSIDGGRGGATRLCPLYAVRPIVTLTLIDDNGEHAMAQGSFAGFPAGPGEETIHYPDDAIGPIRK
jgi:hypothetical protein